MREIAAIVAALCVFGGPMTFLILREYWRAKNRQLELSAQHGNPKQLVALTQEKHQLEARIQNLESIVCSVDFELNQRLNRLAAGASQLAPAALPPAGGADGGVGAGGAAAAGRGGVASTAATALAPPHGAQAVEVAYRLGHLTAGQTVLGRYAVKKELGRGGMGAVYLADDAKLGELVALKVISSIFASDPEEAAERFRREVQAARKVTHPNVIRIHDLGEDGPLMFLSMEYVEGDTLFARVKRGGPLAVAQAREILAGVASGVAAAHAAGVIHRDLKPQNVLLGAGSRMVKVIDFGLAKSSFSNGSTATGMILGTPEYMAPEQIRGGTCDARTDVYALGATAYYTLCGRPPFQGDTPIAIGFAQVHEAPAPPRTIRPEIPASVEATILKALAKDPRERFSDADAFRTAIAD